MVNNVFELTFHNKAGGEGFDEFPKKVDYNALQEKISWRPIESSIRHLEEEDFKTIMLRSGLDYSVIGQAGGEENEDDEGKSPKHGSVVSIDKIAESSIYAMKQAMKYERTHGRKPHDVTDKTVGFDIESKDRNGKEIRYIEVKSRKFNLPVALTDNEFKAAKRLGQLYFLYVVTNDGIHIVKDPARICTSEKVTVVAWHLRDWLEKATMEAATK